MINIFLLHPLKVFSGAHTFTYHLARALKRMSGDTVRVIRANHWKRPNEKYGEVYPGSGLQVLDVRAEDILSYALSSPGNVNVIAFMLDEFSEIGLQLMDRAGASLIIHDRRSYKNFHKELLQVQPRVSCIRKTVVDMATEDGLKDVRYIAHPYGRFGELSPKDPTPPAWAHCLSRIGWEKNIDMLIQANWILPANKQILALGECYDRFAKMKLMKVSEDWEQILGRKLHKVKFTEGYAAAKKSKFAIDLSVLGKHGGGGSQYTFLEAIDAEVPLIIHKDWLIDGDEMVDGYNCFAVGDTLELVEILEQGYSFNPVLRKPMQQGYKETLRLHSYSTTGWEYLDFIKGA